jgi:orotate phosphoribosyltransferase-like protein
MGSLLYGLEVWRMIRDLKERGMSNREIAKELSISRNTVSKLLRKTKIQDKRKRNRRS